MAGEVVAVWDGAKWVSIRGETGPGLVVAGTVATSADLPSTARPGDGYVASDSGHLHVWDGVKWVDAGALQGPPGPKGDTGARGPAGAAGVTGPQGPAGRDGVSPTITVGSVATGAAGTAVKVIDSGTVPGQSILNFTIPMGLQGAQGPAGQDGLTPTFKVGQVVAGSSPSVSLSGTAPDYTLSFALQKGDAGPTGPAGPAGRDGSGVTIKGTVSGGTWPPAGPHANGDMWLIGTPVPTGAPAGSKTGDGVVYNAGGWTNVGPIQGPTGPAGPAGQAGPSGPSAVSADGGNAARLGTDSLIYVPTVSVPLAATVAPVALAATAAIGASTHYARADHVHPWPTATQIGAAASSHTHPAAQVTGLAKVATTGAYADLSGAPAAVLRAGDTMTGPLSISYAAARFSLSGAGAIVQTITSTDTNGATLNLVSGAYASQAHQAGKNFTFTNYSDAGLTTFSQAGAGTIRFVVGGVQGAAVTTAGLATTALSLSGNITSSGTSNTFAAGSIQASAIAGLDKVATAGLHPATATTLGGIKVGSGLSVDAGGTLTAPAAVHPSTVAGAALASSGAVGTSLDYARADHTHARPTAYEISGLAAIATIGLEPATTTKLGGVKIGSGLAVDPDGVLTAPPAINPSTTAGAALATAGAAGTSLNYARADHTHPRPTAAEIAGLDPIATAGLKAATASVLGGVKIGSGLTVDAGGTLTAPAAVQPATVAGAALAAAGTVGTSVDYARADHKHPYPTAANVGALPITGGTVTGLVRVQYAAAQFILTGTGNVTQSVQSTDGGSTTLNISSGTNAGQFNQTGANFTFTNYGTAGNLRFNQNGAGLMQFFVGGIKILELSSTTGGTFLVGLTTPALTLTTKRTPASQTATGVVGQVEWDANYLYMAISANQWRRIPWTDWLDGYRTIASETAAGVKGERCWDDTFEYRCVATNTWRRWRRFTWAESDVSSGVSVGTGTGAIWTSTANQANPQKMIYAGGRFVGITGTTGYRSVDGLTFEAAAITGAPAGPDTYSVAFANGTYAVIVGRTANTTAAFHTATSVEGAAWTDRGSPLAMDSSSAAIVSVADKFIVFGHSLGANYPIASAVLARYSLDGINWAQGTVTGVASQKLVQVNGAAWSGSAGVAVGLGGQAAGGAGLTGTNIGLRTTDGIAWTAVTLPSVTKWSAVVHAAGKFVAVGEGLVGAVSTDGTTWNSMNLPASANWSAVAYGNGWFVAVANGAGEAARSQDGITWSKVTMPAALAWSALRFGAGRFVATTGGNTMVAISE